jgi:hypothetical protein
MGKRPFWVIFGSQGAQRDSPLYPQEQTSRKFSKSNIDRQLAVPTSRARVSRSYFSRPGYGRCHQSRGEIIERHSFERNRISFAFLG